MNAQDSNASRRLMTKEGTTLTNLKMACNYMNVYRCYLIMCWDPVLYASQPSFEK